MKTLVLSTIFAIICLSAAACGTTHEPTVRTVEIQVPVHTACTIAPPVKPEFADSDEALRTAPNHVERVRLLVMGRLQHFAYELELEAHDRACSA